MKKRNIVFGAFGVLFVMGAIGSSNKDEPTKSHSHNQSTVVQTSDESSSSEEISSEVVSSEEKPANDTPVDYISALHQASSYGHTMHMSKQGIYDQLVSEYGGQFSAEAAQYAIDNVDLDYNELALKKAKDYQTTMSMSPEAIRDQLTSEYGERFTPEEAEYAISNLNA